MSLHRTIADAIRANLPSMIQPGADLAVVEVIGYDQAAQDDESLGFTVCDPIDAIADAYADGLSQSLGRCVQVVEVVDHVVRRHLAAVAAESKAARGAATTRRLASLLVALLLLCGGRAAAATPLDQLDADIAAARTAYQTAQRDAYARFLTTAKLAPLPAPELPADPRASEVERHRQLAAVNKVVAELAELRDLPGGWRMEQVQAVLNREALADYFAIRGADAAAEPAKPAGHAPTGGIVKPAR